MISIIVPCYKESLNVGILCNRIYKTIDKNVEILIMDDESDESDNTRDVINNISENIRTRYILRKESEGRGLSSAVMNGIRLANGEIIVVMDGDLQHEPESIPNLILGLYKNDFSIGVRKELKIEWSILRRLISWCATILARGLTKCSDPMSGFFAIRRELVLNNLNKINPIGFKIGLELMIKCGCKNIKEVRIDFQERKNGKSKMNFVQILNYLIHLFNLYIFIFLNKIF